MVNILDIQPEYFLINDFEGCKDGSTISNICCEENSVPYVVLNIECISRKSGFFSYLTFYDKNKKMLDNYVSIVDHLKDEIWSFTGDIYWGEIFVMGCDFIRFRLRTDDELQYNQKINIPVCVISLSCVVKKGDIY